MKKFIVLLSLMFSILGSIVSHADEWRQDSNGWQYVYSDGTFVKNSWLDDPGSGKRYHFDQNGYMQFGVVNVDGKEYYFNDAGELQRNRLIPDGRTLDYNGEIIDNVNDGITMLIAWISDVKVGNGKAISVGITNLCDKTITIKNDCRMISNGNVYTLYLYDVNTHGFYEEKTINPKEQVIMNFIDHNKSEFYIDKSSVLMLRMVINGSEYTCNTTGQNEYVLHASSEKLKELDREIN